VVDGYSQQVSSYWEDVYADEGLRGLVYRERWRRALRWVAEL